MILSPHLNSWNRGSFLDTHIDMKYVHRLSSIINQNDFDHVNENSEDEIVGPSSWSNKMSEKDLSTKRPQLLTKTCFDDGPEGRGCGV